MAVSSDESFVYLSAKDSQGIGAIAKLWGQNGTLIVQKGDSELGSYYYLYEKFN